MSNCCNCALAADTTPVDITAKINLALTDGGKNLKDVTIRPRRYTYNPRAGVVHFLFSMTYDGTLAQNDVLTITHSGGYKPANINYLPFPISSNGNIKMRGDYSYEGEISIKTEEADTGAGVLRNARFSGWYFCDGE